MPRPHLLTRLLLSIATITSFTALIHRPPVAMADASGSGSVTDDNIEAQVSYSSPPQDGATKCSWQRVKGIDPVTSGQAISERGSGPVLETLYFRECNNIIVKYLWVRNSVPAKTAEVAQSKVSKLIPTLLARTAPDNDKLVVNVGTWFWVPKSLWKSVSVTAHVPTAVGPISVTTTATPKKVIFHPGDGNKEVVCVGPGTPWRSSFGDLARSDCSYTYSSASHITDSRLYKTKMSVEWAISYSSNLGVRGHIMDKRIGVNSHVRVFEKQALSR